MEDSSDNDDFNFDDSSSEDENPDKELEMKETKTSHNAPFNIKPKGVQNESKIRKTISKYFEASSITLSFFS